MVEQNSAPLRARRSATGVRYQIEFSGQELADIIAFVHDDEEQHKFTEADIPPEIMALMGHEHAAPGGAAEHREELGHKHGSDGHHGEGHHKD